MKHRKPCLALNIVLASFLLLLLTGCWDYTEIEDHAIVLGAAIDYDEENDSIILTVEIASVVGPGPEATIESRFVQSKGKTLKEASRNALSITGKRLFWSHAKVVILSEDIAAHRQKISSILDFFLRYFEPRDDTLLLLSKEETGRELLEAIETDLHPTNAMYLSEILFHAEKSTKIISSPIWKFQNQWRRTGISPVIPGVRIEKGMERALARVSGAAVFGDEGLVGWLNEKETESLAFIKNEIQRGVLALKDQEEAQRISLRILDNRTRIRPSYEEDLLSIEIHIEMAAVLLESSKEIITIDSAKREALESQGERFLKKQIKELIKKTQTEHQRDIFGFGQTVKREQPAL